MRRHDRIERLTRRSPAARMRASNEATEGSMRAFLTGVLLLTTLPAPARTPAPPSEPVRTADITVRGLTAADFPRVTMLAPNVYAYEQIDPTKRTVTANNLIVVTSDGVLVAEGQGTIENVSHLVADIGRITPQPIRYVVVGSEHGDHTGGDSAFPASATFIAHPFSQANLGRQAEAQRPGGRRIVVPTETVTDTRVLTLGGTEIRILFLGRAHTGGDLEVYLPRERVLFMSEVFSNRVFPSMANSYPTEWIATLKKAEAIPADIVVPAHGFVDSADVLRQEMVNYRRALEQIVSEGARLHDAGVPIESAPAGANFGPFDSWTRAANNAFAALARVYMERDGRLR
jgi:glyoxylase-like metal-dependent hydrolase (beta-lactamase superfamily II)